MRAPGHGAIGRAYLAAGLAFLAFGAAEALLMRWQLAFPGRPLPLIGSLLFPADGGAIAPDAHARLFSTHGLIMVLFAATPILIGWLGHDVLPRLIGADEMAVPWLSRAGLLLFLAGGALALASFLAPGGTAAAGWTSYPPLSARLGSPGPGLSMMALAMLLAGASTVAGAINIILTVLTRRAPGLGLAQLPQLAWGLLLASVLNAVFVPVLAAALGLLLADRHLGTRFFLPDGPTSGGGDPLIYQQLFWIFGHPEVYILILPAWGVIGDLLAFASGAAKAAPRRVIGAFLAVTILSGLVYGHHLFTAGLSPIAGAAFELLTLAVGVPGVVLVLGWFVTLARGPLRLTPAVSFALGSMVAFGAGGLTGLPLAIITSNLWLHDTAYVVGHFHMTMALATLLAALAAILHWLALLTERAPSPRLLRAHFWLTFAPLMLAFGGMLAAGYLGQHRRLSDPSAHEAAAALMPLNRGISALALIGIGAQALLVVAFLRARRPQPRPR